MAPRAPSGIGFIYCLSNPAMPGMVKIGYTNRTVAHRIRELSFGSHGTQATGVPLPFELVKQWPVPAIQAEHIEKHVHHELGDRRVRSAGARYDKEFFFVEPEAAGALVEDVLAAIPWLTKAMDDIEQFEIQAQQNKAEQFEARQAERLRLQRVQQVEPRLRANAERYFAVKMRLHGLLWAAIFGIPSAVILYLLGVKTWNIAIPVFLAIGAYMNNVRKPLEKYLASEDFQIDVALEEASID